ncbi:MAG: type IV secretion system protein [Bryobacteraceae bacterium]|jgi:type IV secretion system protein VirB5
MKATAHLEHDTPDTVASARQVPVTQPAKIAQSKPEPYNPYLAGRREWDERHGDLLSRTRKSDRIAFVCSGIALVLAVALAVVAVRPPRVIVVAVDRNGQYLGSGTSGQPLAVTEDMKRSALSDWVTNVRLVTPDGISQRAAIDKVYSMISSGSSAQTFVSDFYRGAPPQTRAQSQTVHVEVNSVLPTSGETYLIEWIEVTRDLQGKVLFEQRYKGAFSFVVSSSSPNDERLLRLNPIGLYITQASWSKVL